jgi:hypothetical protein
MENPCDACCWVRRKKSVLMGVSPSRWIARHIAKGKLCRQLFYLGIAAEQ